LPKWPRTASTPSISSWTASRSGPTCVSVWRRVSRQRSPTPRARPGGGNGQRHRASVFCQVRLSALRLRFAGTGATPVLLQQPDGRLPEMRWLRQHPVLRSGARGRLSHLSLAPAPSRAGTSATSSTSDVGLAGRPLWLRHDAAVRANAARHQHIVLYGSGREQIKFRYLNEKGTASTATTASRALCPISNGATGRQTRSWCVRSWPNT